VLSGAVFGFSGMAFLRQLYQRIAGRPFERHRCSSTDSLDLAPGPVSNPGVVAQIIGGIATSHSPTIGFAHDRHTEDDPVWGPIFTGYKPIREWLAQKKPDVLFIVFNDHVTSFFFDHYSHFALGIGESYLPADEGAGPRNLPPVKGHSGLAHHVATALVAEEFDLSFFQDRPLDHGCFSPLSMLWPHEPDWPGKIVPLQVGVLQFPIPSARRCYKLGQSLRRAIESYPEDLSVVVVGTGGLSHQVHGERAGFNNTEWDMKFMELIETDPVALTELTIADFAKRGGFESAEVIMWLIMRGALPAKVRRTHQSYYLPSMTALATAIYENYPEMPELERPDSNEAYRNRIRQQWAGIETLPGTYPFTLDKSIKAYRLNKFLYKLTDPDIRKQFLANPEDAFDKANLTSEERDMIGRRAWRELIHYGVIFFLLEKLGAVLGVSNLHIYAAMRGQTLEEFQKTRNTQVLYSVAGKDMRDVAWNQTDDERQSSH
jgi:gallate dioxygenase